MPIKDNKSMTDVLYLQRGNIVSDTVTNSNSVDTADLDNGVTFIPYLNDTAGGNVALTSIQESTDNGFTDPFVDISTAQINGDLADFATLVVAADDEILLTIGVFGVKRFVRLVLTSTGGTSGSAFRILVNEGIEITPGQS